MFYRPIVCQCSQGGDVGHFYGSDCAAVIQVAPTSLPDIGSLFGPEDREEDDLEDIDEDFDEDDLDSGEFDDDLLGDDRFTGDE